MCAPVTGASSVPLYGAVLGFGSSTAEYPALDADFGSAPPPNAIIDKGVVAQTLGGDGLPVYAGGADGSATTTGPSAFPAWFGGAPASPSAVDASVVLQQSGGTLAYSSSAYFPLDQDSEDLFTVVFLVSCGSASGNPSGPLCPPRLWALAAKHHTGLPWGTSPWQLSEHVAICCSAIQHHVNSLHGRHLFVVHVSMLYLPCHANMSVAPPRRLRPIAVQYQESNQTIFVGLPRC